MVRKGRSRIGESFTVPLPGQSVKVTLTEPVFFDPEGVRINA
jgi:sarcosine oxidase subunit alpha